MLTRFLAGRAGRVDQAERTWLRARLFDRGRFVDEDPAVRTRYRDAEKWAVRLLDRILTLPVEARISTLRCFHAADAPGKLELIGKLAA